MKPARLFAIILLGSAAGFAVSRLLVGDMLFSLLHAGGREHVNVAVIGGRTYDFGLLREGEVRTHEFSLLSQDPFVVTRVTPSCGCTSAAPYIIAEDGRRSPYSLGTPIPRDAQLIVVATVDSAGRRGHLETKVTVQCTDNGGIIVLGLTATIEPVLAATPGTTLFLGELMTNERREGSLSVSATRGEPFLLRLTHPMEDDTMAVSLSAVDPDSSGRSPHWTVRVTVGPSIELGTRSRDIHLESDLLFSSSPAQGHPARRAAVILHAQAKVNSIVTVSPELLRLGQLRPGEVVERSLSLESTDGFAFPTVVPIALEGLRGEECPLICEAVQDLTHPRDGHTAWKLRFSPASDHDSGSLQARLRIGLGHPMAPEVLVRVESVALATDSPGK